jgi:hypothetical protein
VLVFIGIAEAPALSEDILQRLAGNYFRVEKQLQEFFGCRSFSKRRLSITGEVPFIYLRIL